MNISGEKVRVRDKIADDYLREFFWAMDIEVIAFDPAAGKAFNSQSFSIETLDGKHIGSCSLHNQTTSNVEFGIRIGDRDYWNKGYGAEVVGILVEYYFATTDVGYVWLKVLPENMRVIRCYEKCGFVRAGRLALDGYDFVRMEKRRP